MQLAARQVGVRAPAGAAVLVNNCRGCSRAEGRGRHRRGTCVLLTKPRCQRWTGLFGELEKYGRRAACSLDGGLVESVKSGVHQIVGKRSVKRCI